MKFPVFYLVSILFGIISKTSSECINGLEGIDGKYFLNEDVEVCCPVECNGCGDDGCHLIGKENDLDHSSCCTSQIVWANVTCEDSGEAPCLIEPLSSEFTRDENGLIVFESSVPIETDGVSGIYSLPFMTGCILFFSMVSSLY